MYRTWQKRKLIFKVRNHSRVACLANIQIQTASCV